MKKFEKVLTSRKICSEVYFHHFENRFLNVIFFTIVNLFTINLYTSLNNKNYLLLQFIEKIVKFKFFFSAEFDIPTSNNNSEMRKSTEACSFFTIFSVKSYEKSLFTVFLQLLFQSGLWTIAAVLFEICQKTRKSSMTMIE